MFTSVGKGTMFVLIVVLASAYLTTQTVNAACTERPADNSTADTAVDKVSNFFVEVGCTFKSGAERIKERVESGYNYLKSKITPEDMKNQTLADGKTSDDRITFQEDELASGGIGGSVQTATPATFHETPGIDFRTALIAPEMCPQGQVRVDGRCRLDADV